MMDFLKVKSAALLVVLLALLIAGSIGCLNLRKDTASDYPGQLEGVTPTTPTTGQVGEADRPSGMPACICHSKKPSMVRMHEALEGEDCGLCHEPGENLMDPNRTASQIADLNKRKDKEAICKECHKDGKTVVKKLEKSKTKISNALFCPKCKKQLDLGDKTCGDCGGTVTNTGDDWVCSACGPLVDIDKIALLSKENPSNDICRLCHFEDKSLAVAHKDIKAYNKTKSEIPGGSNDCLSCHEAHNQCGGCHF